VACDDAVHDDDEGAGRAADLHAAAAERADEEARDDRGGEALLRPDARRDRERDRERQRHDADDHAREEVARELRARQPFTQDGPQLRLEPAREIGQRGRHIPPSSTRRVRGYRRRP
jgi:hypothetical protein